MSKLLKVEFYVPNKVVDNHSLQSEFPEANIERVARKIGVSSRRIAEDGETASDLGLKAAQKVLESFDSNNIDLLIFCTQSPDYFLPTSACILQHKLGLRNIPAYDFNLGCSGYIYGLAMADSFISAGIASNVLLITGETYSKHIFPKDKANRMIFGDGASASIISEGLGVGKFDLGSDGSGYDKLIVPNGGFRNKKELNADIKEYGSDNYYDDNHVHMDGPEVFNFTIKVVPETVKKALSKNNINIDEIDLFIFHQANEFMLNHLRNSLGIPRDKFYISMKNTGNTVSSTIPICIVNALQEGEIKTGDNVMLVGFGVGLSWGATVIKF